MFPATWLPNINYYSPGVPWIGFDIIWRWAAIHWRGHTSLIERCGNNTRDNSYTDYKPSDWKSAKASTVKWIIVVPLISYRLPQAGQAPFNWLLTRHSPSALMGAWGLENQLDKSIVFNSTPWTKTKPKLTKALRSGNWYVMTMLPSTSGQKQPWYRRQDKNSPDHHRASQVRRQTLPKSPTSIIASAVPDTDHSLVFFSI